MADPVVPVLGEGAGGAESGFLRRIRQAVDVLRFRARAIDEVAADEAASTTAVLIVALAGVAAAAGYGLFLPAHAVYGVVYIAISLAFAGAVHLLAVVALRASGDFLAFYRAFAFTYLALWITSIPIVEALFIWAVRLWQLAAIVLVAERVYRLERVQAVGVVAVPTLIVVLAAVLLQGAVALASILGGALF